MTRTILSYLLILLMGVVTANAEDMVLDFNDLQIGEGVLDYYNGGNGSLGTGPGPNFGIIFTADFVTVEQGVFGPPFQGAELVSTSGIMDIVPGFIGTFSFYFWNSGPDGTANLYSGPDGGGSLVGTLALPADSAVNTTGDSEPRFESVVFSGTPGALVFDNMTFGPPGSGPGGGIVIPETSSIDLLLIGLLAVWLGSRKRHHGSITGSGR
jgi:hypothetical protein